MNSKQLKLLVSLQDLDTMVREASEEEGLGFKTEGAEKLRQVRDELRARIDPALLRTYDRLSERYKRAVVPVKDDTCLGCFMRLPTSVAAKGRKNISIICCESCGRFLYWLE